MWKWWGACIGRREVFCRPLTVFVFINPVKEHLVAHEDRRNAFGGACRLWCDKVSQIERHHICLFLIKHKEFTIFYFFSGQFGQVASGVRRAQAGHNIFSVPKTFRAEELFVHGLLGLVVFKVNSPASQGALKKKILLLLIFFYFFPQNGFLHFVMYGQRCHQILVWLAPWKLFLIL